MVWFWHSLIAIGIFVVGFVVGAAHMLVTRATLDGDDLKTVEGLESEIRDILNKTEEE